MSNVQQSVTTGKVQTDLSALAAKRRAAALKTAATKASKRPPLTDEEKWLAGDMSLNEALALTPEQKKKRAQLRKAKWWRDRYNAEKNGTAPISSVTRHKPVTAALENAFGIRKDNPIKEEPMNQDHVPEEFRHLFTDEEMHEMRPLTLEEVHSLGKPAYNRRKKLKARLYYAQHRDRISESQKRYSKNKKMRVAVATQPVTHINQPTPPMAMPIKLDSCPFCMARFWGVKGKEVVE